MLQPLNLALVHVFWYMNILHSVQLKRLAQKRGLGCSLQDLNSFPHMLIAGPKGECPSFPDLRQGPHASGMSEKITCSKPQPHL